MNYYPIIKMLRFSYTSLVIFLITNYLRTVECSDDHTMKNGVACVLASEECLPHEIGFSIYTPESQQISYIYDLGMSQSYELDNINLLFNSFGTKMTSLKMIIHDFAQNKENNYVTELKNAYLRDNENILLVNYGPVATIGCQKIAAQNTEVVAKCSEKALKKLKNDNILSDFENVHIVGFGLGSQIAGQIGYRLCQDVQSTCIGHITGLDPSFSDYLEIFSNTNELTLSRSDAKFVEIVHTNSGIIGKLLPEGDVDYYVNGGVFQPGCNHYSTEKVEGIGYTYRDICSHTYAFSLFTQNVNPTTAIKAYRCDDIDGLFNINRSCKINDYVIFGDNGLNTEEDIDGIFVVLV